MDVFECGLCGRRKPADVFDPFCPHCGAPVLLAPTARSRAVRPRARDPLERYGDFLPAAVRGAGLSLGEGRTPLQRLTRLEDRLGLPAVYAKNEAINPTSSFKDRGTVAAVRKALSLGLAGIGTISTGNMAGSTAAYAAKAGLKALVFVKDDTPREKILAAGVYGAAVVKVRGDYASLFRRSFEIGRGRGFWFMNSVDPFRIEGYKVAAYEIAEELAFAAPDFLFVPVSAGGHLIGLIRGFLDLRAAGLIHRIPAFVGVQARGCAPIARAFRSGRKDIRRFPNPRTIAHAISNPMPPGGALVLKLLRGNGGRMADVADRAILRAQALLAREEGVFCDPASATVLAALLDLVEGGIIRPGHRVVLVVTGSGLKTLGDLPPASVRAGEADLADLDRAVGRVL